MKKLLVALSLITALTACGGSDSKAIDEPTVVTPSGCADASNCTESEIVSILDLPDEPTEDMAGFDTVRGVDSNSNNIRDDIERYIGLKHYPDTTKINVLNAFAESDFQQHVAYETGDGALYSEYDQKMYNSISCYSELYDRYETTIISSNLDNTDDRVEAGFKRSVALLKGKGMVSYSRPIKGYTEICLEKYSN